MTSQSFLFNMINFECVRNFHGIINNIQTSTDRLVNVCNLERTLMVTQHFLPSQTLTIICPSVRYGLYLSLTHTEKCFSKKKNYSECLDVQKIWNM